MSSEVLLTFSEASHDVEVHHVVVVADAEADVVLGSKLDLVTFDQGNRKAL